MTMFKRILSVGIVYLVSMIWVAFANPDMAVTAHTMTPVNYGGAWDVVDISVTYTNSGTLTATGTTISYTLPSQMAFSGVPAGWTVLGNVATLTGNIPASAVVVVTWFSATINSFLPLQTLTWSITVTTANDTNSGNNTLTAWVVVWYSVWITKTVSRINWSTLHSGMAISGDLIEFTITAINSGTFPVDFSITDNVSLISQMTFANSNEDRNFSNVLPGSGRTYTFTGLVTIPTFSSIVNNASLYSFPNYTRYASVNYFNLSTAQATLLPRAVFSLLKMAPAIMPQPGTQAIYTLLVSNIWSTSVGYDLLDTLPNSDVTYVSMTRNGTPITPAWTSCTLLGICSFTGQTVASNATNTYLLTVLVKTGASLSFTNTWSITTTSPTAIVTSGLSTAVINVAGVPDLYINKSLATATWAILSSGDLVVFNFAFGNSGAQNVSNVTIRDDFSSQLSFLTGTLNGVTPVLSGGDLLFQGMTMNTWSSFTGALSFVVNGVGAEARNFSNTWSITLVNYPSAYETSLSNNTSVVTGYIYGVADLYAIKTLSWAAPLLSGDFVTYTIVVGNSGWSSVAVTGDMQIIDIYSWTYLNYVTWSIVPSWLLSGVVVYNLTGVNFAPGQSMTFSVTFQLNSSPAMWTVVWNFVGAQYSWAVVTSNDEFNFANNSSSVVTIIWGSPELSIMKTWPASVSWIVGTQFNYTLVYQNTGTLSATWVTILDQLPTGLIPAFPITGGGIYNTGANTITWTIPTMATWSSQSLVYWVVVNGLLTWGNLVNTGIIDPNNVFGESNELNNISTASTSVIAFADIAITSKTIVSQGAALSGSTTIFAINYVNNGSVTGDFVWIVDNLPSIFTYISGCSGMSVCLWSWQLVTWLDITVWPGQTWQFLIPVMLNTQPIWVLNYINTATIWLSWYDANSTNNTGSVTGSFAAALDIVVTKTAQPIQASWYMMSGGLVNYTVVVTNNGTIPVSWSLSDIWPLWSLSNNNATLLYTGLSLPTGTNLVFNFSGNLLSNAVTWFTNTANFNFTVGSTWYISTGAVTVQVPNPVCGNSIIERNEMCEVINGVTYPTNILLTGQQCIACNVRTVEVVNVWEICIGSWFLECDTDINTLPVLFGNPFLTIDKSVTPSVNLASGDLVRYTVVITNTGTDVATNVLFQDQWPWTWVAYVSHSTSPSFNLVVVSGSMMSGTIPSIATGQSVTVYLTWRVIATGSAVIDNIAFATYTNLSWTTTIQDNALIYVWQWWVCQSPVLLGSRVLRNGEANIEVTCRAGSGNSATQIRIDCGNWQVFNGLWTSYTRTCEYDDNDEYTIACSVDWFTSSSCEDDINIIDPEVSICGDGVIWQFESCDLWNDQEDGVYVTIEDILWLDLDGDFVDSDEYEWASCYNCAIIDDNNPVTPPVCNYTDTSLSVMPGEILPFWWDVEVDKWAIDSYEDCDQDEIWSVIKDSMICEFAVMHNSDGDEVVDTFSFPCNQSLDYDIFNTFTSTTSEFTDVDDSFGRFLIELNDNIDSYWEYKIRLEKVEYNYCGYIEGELSSVKWIPFCRVCETNFAMTRPYLMQLWANSSQASDQLEDFYDMQGERILTSSEINNIDSVRYSDFDWWSDIDTLLSSFVQKQDRVALSASLWWISSASSIKKVPWSNIFVIEWDVTYTHNELLWVATIIVKNGDLVIDGSVWDNIMFIVPDWTISFRDTECTRQIVRGILIAWDWFEALEEDEGQINNDRDKERCSQWWLTIEWVMVWNNIESLVESKRSNLNHWFTFEDENFGNDESERKERRNEILYWASLLVKYNSSLWAQLPPWWNEVVQTLSIDKQ